MRLITGVLAWFGVATTALGGGWSSIGPVVLAQADPANPFASKPQDKTVNPSADGQKPAGATNPFAQKPAAESGSTNPFGAKPTTPPKPATPKPKEEPGPAPKPPAEVVVGTGWSVKPDPSATPLAAVAPAAIPAPGPPASSDARRERTRYRVATAAVPAPVVGIGLNEKEGDSRDVWDLAANRKLGAVKGLALEGSRFMSLSPDGALFAAKPQFDDFVVVFGVASGAKQKTIPIGGMRLDMLAFSAPNRLVLAEDGRLVVHSIPDGKREREIKIDKWSVRDGWALTPGGRFLAAILRESADRNLVTFVDLTTGESAGTCRLTGDPGDLLGIGISRDGTRLAGVIDDGDGVKVLQIELAGPKRLPDFKVAAAPDLFGNDSYQGPVLEWLPDGKHLLIAGRLAIDTALSEIARTLPPPPISPLVSVGPGVALAFDGRELAPVPLNLSIDATRIPVIKPAESQPRAPVNGPAIVQADRSKAVAKSITSGRWDVRLAAPPTVSDKLDTNGFKIPGGYIHQVLLANGSPPVAIVSYAASPLGDGVSASTAAWIEAFDLISGNSVNRVDFSFPTVAVAVSPGAKSIATLSQDDAGRVDVWSLEDDRHLGGCLPAGQRPDRQTPWFVEFVDAEHLLVAVADELSLWEIPAWKQVYTLPIGPIRPALSPAHDHAIVSVPDENRVAVVETLTGNVRGSISTSSVQGDKPLAAAFHHRGRWAAVLSGGAGSGELAVVETDSGRDTSRFRIPMTGDVLQFCDDDHLLVDGHSLISVAKERIVWTYQLQTGLHCRDSFGGFHWYIAAINPADKAYILYGAALPEDAAKKQVQTSTKTSPMIFKPGDSVKVDVATTDFAGPHIIKHVKEAFTKRYQSAGMKIADDAQIAFMIDPGRMGAPRTSVWKVSLLQAGQTVWVGWIQGTPEGSLLLANEPAGTETRFADPPEVRAALAGLLHFDPPKFAFARGAGLGDGTSILTTSGPRPQK
ncbi:MAG TPA: hypothetical protein VM510_03545 [Caulifigura sp.]|nr:hypothetical protein [Caulifigura sp.]